MDWQQIVVGIIVAATVILFVWNWLRPRKLFAGKGGGSGCSSGGGGANQSSIVVCGRKGERPTVIVRNK